jgi:hypothetical protein
VHVALPRGGSEGGLPPGTRATDVPDTLCDRRVGIEGARASAPSRSPRLSRPLLFAFLPLAMGAVLLPPLFLVFGVHAVWEGLRLLALSCLSSGRLVMLEAGSTEALEPFLLAAGVFAVDLCFAFPLAYNLDGRAPSSTGPPGRRP